MTDAIDLSTVTIHNSPNIHAWPATTAITRLALMPTGVHVEFTKQDGPDRWPDVPFMDAGGTLQFTLWIFLNIDEAWHAAGCIEFWHGLYENGGPVDEYAKNWYYDPNRWSPMSGYQPRAGELVGFCITSGDARHGDSDVGLHERSNIVAVHFPDPSGDVFTFPADAPPAPTPTPAPGPMPDPPAPPAPTPTQPGPDRVPPLEEKLEQLAADLNDLIVTIDTLHGDVQALNAKLETVIVHGVKVHL